MKFLHAWTIAMVVSLLAGSATLAAAPTSTAAQESDEQAAASTTDEAAPADGDIAKGENGEEKPFDKPTLLQRAKEWGSTNLAVLNNKAARAYNKKQFSGAVNIYRRLIGQDPQNEIFYIGLYKSAVSDKNWDQAVLALEELVDLNEELKVKVAKQFAEALRKTHDDDRAVDYEKLAAKGASTYLDDQFKALIDRSIYFEKPKKPKPKPKPREVIRPEDVHAHTSKHSLTYQNMFNKSEKIIVARYKGFEDDGTISFYDPPKAVYKVEDFLKGGALNKTIYVRYEFHEKVGEPKPKGWKWSKDLMPKKGSKWIIFIHNAIPVDGMYETYHGCFGRQPYSEDNLDKILRIVEKHKGQTN